MHANAKISGYATGVKEELKEYLERYMDAVQIQFKGEGKGSFRCPNLIAHAHGDKNFSGSFVSRSTGKKWKCYRCCQGGDIFELAYFVEGLPKGNIKEFWTITVPTVAERVGYPLKEDEYYKSIGTDEESEVKPMLTAKLLGQINKTIRTRLKPEKIGSDYSRNYTKEICKGLSDIFQIFFPTRGDLKFLPESIQLRDDKVIDTGNMVIPLHSRYGNLSGFIARRPNKKITRQSIRKYLYTSSMNENERMNLFNIHRARPSVKASGIVYMFEAQFDCMVPFVMGLTNAISTGISPDIEYLSGVLREMGAREVVIVLDRDTAGISSTVRMYKGLTDEGFISSIFSLPPNIDADEFVIKEGIEKLKDPQNRQTAVEYIIENEYGELGSDQLSQPAKYMYALDYVVKFSRNIATATAYANIIAKKFTMKSAEDVHCDIAREMNTRKDPLVVRCDTLIKDRTREITSEPDIESKVAMLDQLNDDMRQIYSTHLTGALSEELHDIDMLLTQGDETDRGRIMTGMEDLDNAIRLYPGTLMFVGGRSSSGKSTWIRAMVPSFINSNENITILHLSLDDTAKDTMDGVVANLSGIDNETIEENKFTPAQHNKIAEAQVTVRSWAQNRIYYLCGQSRVSSNSDIRNIVRRAQILTPDNTIILIVDNLMNLSDIADATPREKRILVEQAANKIHTLTQSEDLISIVVVELTKGGPYRPSLLMLKETGVIEYRAKIVALTHNDWKANPNSKVFWKEKNREDSVWPVLEIEFPKYKTGSPNRRIFMKMNPALNRLNPATRDEKRKWNRTIATEERAKKNGGGNRERSERKRGDEFDY